MGIDTGVQRDIQGHNFGYRHRCTQIDWDNSVAIDTGVQTYTGAPALV